MADTILTTKQLPKLMAWVTDQVMDSNTFATMMLVRAESWDGDYMEYPVQIAKPVNVGSFSGMDLLPTVPQNDEVLLRYEPRFVRASLTLAVTDLMRNSVRSAVRSLLKTEATKTAIGLADSIGTQFYGDGTGNGNKNLLGLDAIVDDGTNVATIGGQSRAMYPSLDGHVVDFQGVGSLELLANTYNQAKYGTIRPDISFTTQECFDLVETLMEQKARYNDSNANADRRIGGFGFDGLKYRGIDIVSDQHCPDGNIYFLNTDYLHFAALNGDIEDAGGILNPIMYRRKDVKGNDFASSVPGYGFKATNILQPVNQLAIVNHIVLGGNLMTDMPRGQSKGINFDAV